jgi:hypothetical protein
MLNLIKRLATYISLWCACNLCPYIYQAQLLHIQQGCSPRYVVLLGDRHVCPKSEWAVAMEQSQVLLNWIVIKFMVALCGGCGKCGTSYPKTAADYIAQNKKVPELDVCCAAISIRTKHD